MLGSFQSITEQVLGLLFPDRCVGCGRGESLLCAACHARLRAYPDTPHVSGLEHIWVAFIFEEPIQAAIHTLKYDGKRRMANVLGDLVVAHLRRYPLPPLDALAAVPLHPKRLAERGFNQSELVARRLMQPLGLPLLVRGLVRVRYTTQQVGLTAAERHENMRDAFAWNYPAPPPARILLIDDVLTTGATLHSCARALRAAGTKEVYGLTVVRSWRQE